jgi:hypothetical protein
MAATAPRKIAISDCKILHGGYCQYTLLPQAPCSITPGQYISIHADDRWLHLPVMGTSATNGYTALSAVPPINIDGKDKLYDFHVGGESLLPRADIDRIVLVAENAAIAAGIYAAGTLRKQRGLSLMVFAQFDAAPPFLPVPSQILLRHCPVDAIAAIPLLDDWNIASRLISRRQQPGFYQGDICELLTACQLTDENNEGRLQILGCGSDNFVERLLNWCSRYAVTGTLSRLPG